MKQEEIDLSSLLHGTALEEVDSKHPPDFVTAQLIVDCHCTLGEGILFDDRTHAVLWTDIDEKKLHKLQLDYKQPTKIIWTTYDDELPNKKLGSFGLLQQQTKKEGSALPLLCAWEDGFQLYDIQNCRELSELSQGEDVNPDKGLTRLNDGKVEPNGNRYICGGFYGETPGLKCKVFKVEQKKDGKLVHEPIVDSVECTNSICWSLDGKTMYLADSPTQQIHSYDYKDGRLSNKKLLHEKPHNEKSVPDGSCVDTEGYLWNAVWRYGEGPSYVQRIDPKTGHVVFTVHMPDSTSQVSCCCFGGENMDILFITTAATGRDKEKEPHAGALYAAKVPFQGRKEPRLNFTY